MSTPPGSAGIGGRRLLRSLLVSVLLTLLVSGPTLFVLMPHLVRWQQLAALDSADPARRGQALAYVVHRARYDPRVLRNVLAQAMAGDDNLFMAVAGALDQAGVWQRTRVGAEAWLRWLKVRLAETDPLSRIAAVQACADLADLATDPRLVGLLRRAIADADADVRYNGLFAAAELAGAVDPADRRVLEGLIAQRVHDVEVPIARHAWLLLGLLDPFSGTHGDWRGAPLPVAQAMLWAAVRTNPDVPRPALEVLADADADADLRAVAQYVLTLRAPPQPVGLDAASMDPRPHLNASRAALRDLACLAVAMRADDTPADELDSLVAALLTDLDDHAKMSGTMLAGLTGRRLDLLAKRLAVEDQHDVRQVMRLGLWMADQPVADAPGAAMDMHDLAPLLLTDSRLPTSTVLFAALRRRPELALDYLLAPRAEAPPMDLADLLVTQRWWYVLHAHLPGDAPDLWVWAPPAVLELQLDALRDWWVLNRQRPFPPVSARSPASSW